MIVGFAAPFPGELLYGAIGRYLRHSGGATGRYAARRLFGSGDALAVRDLPGHLGHLIAALPPGHGLSADELGERHTLYPYFASFLPPARRRQLREDMRGDRGPAIHSEAGIPASTVPRPPGLRYCPACATGDRETHGEALWHRLHQVPGVEVCAQHETWLEPGAGRLDALGNRATFIVAEDAIPAPDARPLAADTPHHDALLAIARDTAWLLDQRDLTADPDDLVRRYRDLLDGAGLLTVSGRVRQRGLRERIGARYGDLLDRLGCSLDPVLTEDWLTRLVRTPGGAQHPLHHLLLIQGLGHTAATFFALPADRARDPFGRPPYPCLNVAGGHHGAPTIAACRVTPDRKRGGRPVGTFACPQCGFVYARSGPDRIPEDRRRIGRVRAFGHAWEAALREEWADAGISLEGAARRLGVDAKTVRARAASAGLPWPKPGGRMTGSAPPARCPDIPPTGSSATDDPGARHRAAWLAALSRRPTVGVTALRAELPATYAWLYRWDREWLRAHAPRAARRPAAGRVDWERRDARIARDVARAVRQLAAAPGRPARITRAALGRHSGHLAHLQKHPANLPLATAALLRGEEGREAFALRRVRWAVARYREEGVCPARWRFVARAGLGRVAAWPAVRVAIDVALGNVAADAAHRRVA